MVDQLGQRKMNRDKALSSTYTSVLKIHAKVIGISPHGLIGPAEKNGVFMLSLKYYLTGILYNNNF